MRLQRRLLAGLAALALTAPAAASAQSAGGSSLIAALSGDRTLLTIDTSSRKVTRRVTVQGVSRLLSIDLRPADGQLYGLDADGSVVVINPTNGRTTAKSQLQTSLPSGVRINVDFNPVVDRLRIVGEDGTNLRANVDDGTVTVDPDLNFPPPAAGGPDPGTPNVLAAAYTNNVPGTTSTLLYDITARDILYLQLPANSGTLNTVGGLGINVQNFGFEIQTRDGRNRGWIVSGTNIYEIDLSGGRVFNRRGLSNLNGAVVRDITALRQGG